jgi:hypothetical protein
MGGPAARAARRSEAADEEAVATALLDAIETE